MRAAHPPVWSNGGRAMVGTGDCVVHDPGVGDERYQRALDLVSDSPAGFGFASFTFDTQQPGSVVVIPEGTQHGNVSTTGRTTPSGRVAFDGVGDWSEGFSSAMACLERGEIEKVVLARKMVLGFDDRVDVETVLSSLRGQGAGRFLFGIEGLVGASPELLVSLQAGHVASSPLAGTSESAKGLTDPRIQLEHRLTAEYVLASLSDEVDDLRSEPEVVDLGAIKHLGTRVWGRARPGTNITDLLSRLHPTPAVAGVPREAAVDLISRIERTRRGRYAGPVGWIDSDGNGEFAVALRCGLVEGSHVTLHAGGGLVLGSDSARELAETDLKLQPMLSALGVEA